MFGRKDLEGKERKWKEICYFLMFGSLKKIKWKKMGGIGRKDSFNKISLSFPPKSGGIWQEREIYTKHGKLRFFERKNLYQTWEVKVFFLSLPFFSFLFPSFLFSSFPLLKMNQTHCMCLLKYNSPKIIKV